MGRDHVDLGEIGSVEELKGKLSVQHVEDKLMRSVLDNDKQAIDEGDLIEEVINQGIGGFTPDLIFEQLVSDYALCEHIYGEKIIRALSGYDPSYVERNIRIPEFQRVVKKNIDKAMQGLKAGKLVDHAFNITEKGFELAGLVLFVKELDKIRPSGIQGERVHKRREHYGERADIKSFKKGDRYRNIAIKRSVTAAIRRGHKTVEPEDLRVFERERKGRCVIIYALDASGSMKGEKIEACKKAAIALAYKANTNKDKVGIVVFGKDVTAVVEPTMDFARILHEVVRIRAANQTDMAASINKAVELFGSADVTKHLLFITDAQPTAGDAPEEETIKAVAIARSLGITTSLIGIRLDKGAEEFGRFLIEQGGGSLYLVDDLDDMRAIVLEDYHRVA